MAFDDRFAMSRGSRPGPPYALLTGLLVCLATATPGLCGYTVLSTSLDEINEHQAQALVGSLFGDHPFLAAGKSALSGHVSLGSSGNDLFSGAAGLSWQTADILPFQGGISYTYLDAEFETRTWALNFQDILASGSKWDWVLQVAAARQALTGGNRDRPKAFRENGYQYPPLPGNPLILVDDFTWTQGLVQVLARPRLWIFRPVLGAGIMVGRFSYSGKLCNEVGSCENPGDPVERAGWFNRVIWGAGIGFHSDPLRPFVGLASVAGGVLILGRVTVVF